MIRQSLSIGMFSIFLAIASTTGAMNQKINNPHVCPSPSSNKIVYIVPKNSEGHFLQCTLTEDDENFYYNSLEQSPQTPQEITASEQSQTPQNITVSVALTAQSKTVPSKPWCAKGNYYVFNYYIDKSPQTDNTFKQKPFTDKKWFNETKKINKIFSQKK